MIITLLTALLFVIAPHSPTLPPTAPSSTSTTPPLVQCGIGAVEPLCV